uniref:Zinc finger DNA binding protein n=1 Tax=Cacopsylla melanoneura TaxID=428564 RepID=A0A8D9E972_9HEMI
MGFKPKPITTQLTPPSSKTPQGPQTNMVSQIDDYSVKLITDSLTTVFDIRFNKLKAEFDRQFAELNQKLTEERKEKDGIKRELEQVKERNNKLEQYTRRNNLRIFGLKEENKEDVEIKVLKVLNEKLNIPINKDDIEACHRTGRLDNAKGGRNIIVRFVSRKVRDNVFRNKRLLKDTRIFINEDLTEANLKLFKMCSEKFGKLNTYTWYGNIMVVCNGVKRTINNEKDLNRPSLTGPPNSSAT